MCDFFSCLVVNRGALGFEYLSWYTDHKAQIADRVRELARRIVPFYDDREDAIRAAWDRYDDVFLELKEQFPKLELENFREFPELEGARDQRVREIADAYNDYLQALRPIEGYVPE